MSEQSLGAYRVDIIADSTTAKAEVMSLGKTIEDNSIKSERASKRADDAAKRAADALGKKRDASDRLAASLKRQADTLGMNRDELIRYKAAATGNVKLLEDIDKRLAASNARLRASAGGMSDLGVSARQTAAAMRGVPAQLTDIFTSLQGGQNPMTVLFQQGGQLKDMFGGIVPAAKALGGTIAGMVTPLTLAAGAVAGLAVAWNQASGEADAFNRALILTGNQSSITADQLGAMAQKLDDTTSVTRGKAADVLAEVAASGKFTAEQIGQVAEAAIRMEAATGKAISATVSEFASLAGDPVEALLKLNETQHFLTDSTLEQVKSLQEQGREADATAVAFTAFADTTISRADAAAEHVSALGMAAKGVGGAFKESWDEVSGWFISFDKEVGEAILSLGTLKSAWSNLSIGGPGGAFAGMASLSPPPNFSAVEGGSGTIVDSKAVRAKEKAEQDWSQIVKRNLSDQKRLEQDIADIRAAGKKNGVDASEIEKQVSEARARAAEKGPKPAKLSDRNTGATLLASIRQQLALNEVELAQGEKLEASDRLRAQMQTLLADGKAKVTAATRAAMEAELGQLESQERYREIAEVNALIDTESAKALAEVNQAKNRQAESIARVAEELQFEMDMLGRSALEQSKMIALRQAGVSAASDEGQSISELVEEYHKLSESQGFINDVRSEFANFAVSAVSDFKRAGDAAEEFRDRIKRMALQMLADKAIQYLSNMFGGGVGPVQKAKIGLDGGISYGGGRAAGGPVSKSRIYEVGEGGNPEILQSAGRTYLIPGNDGNVIPAHGARSRGGGGGSASSPVGEPRVTVNIHGASSQTDVKTKRGADGGIDIDVMFKQVRGMIAGDIAGGGPTLQAIKSRLDVRER